MSYNVLVLGASYGSLLGTKLVLAGHNATLICLPLEVEAINRSGARVRLPVKGQDKPVEIDTRTAPGKLTAAAPNDVDPKDFDLVALAMQEPQYGSAGVRELLDRVALSGKPCMSIMNMPPLPYIKRIPNLDTQPLEVCYTDASVWRNFDPENMTFCSPDPQAFRPPDEAMNVLQVTLPTNFKAARFKSEAYTQILRKLQADIEAIDLPVKLKVHESIFVPLAKWAMLITGNYRCVQKDGPRSIKDAVHSDIEASRAVYEWVHEMCIKLGASRDDLVPFEKYANAAQVLVRPSSAARALYAGAPNIERVDRLVQMIGAQHGMKNAVLDQTVALVDERIALNRAQAAEKTLASR